MNYDFDEYGTKAELISAINALDCKCLDPAGGEPLLVVLSKCYISLIYMHLV